jgi:predicted transposase YbfD/YdcC
MSKLIKTEINPTTKTISQEVVSISPNIQDKVVDQVLLQAGGVGLGVLVTIFGIIIIANWMGIKPAIQEWINKQKVESETLRSISEALSLLTKETQQHNSRCAEDTSKIMRSVESVDIKINDIKDDLRELSREVRMSKGSKDNQ